MSTNVVFGVSLQKDLEKTKEKKNRNRKRGKTLFERQTRFDWQSPWTLFPLFPVVQRLIKFVENVSSRTNIFKNKIVKIEEHHSQMPSLHCFHAFCNFLDALASLKPGLFTESVSESVSEWYFSKIADNLRIHQWKWDSIVPTSLPSVLVLSVPSVPMPNLS